MPNPIDDKIRQRGHWLVRIRPSRFVDDRITNINSLLPLLERCAVNLRGWDFPHISRDGQILQLDYIEQADEWGEHIEFWRFYKSGQFIDRLALREDWMDQAALDPAPSNWEMGRELNVTGAVFSWTEIFEFAARLAVTDAGDEVMRIEIQLRGLEGRRLVSRDRRRAPFVADYFANIVSFPFERDISREDLVARPRELAIDAAIELFQYFGWEPSRDVMAGVQDELRS